jgi:NAD(P)-dependent dehydrogenase (short-subunit alcohol dehydrogenase family)
VTSLRFDGERVLVTGSSSGAGAAMARAFAEAGARVAVHAGSRRDAAEAVAAALPGGGHAAFVADLADAAQARRLFAEVAARLGPPTILVNNAGPYSDTPLRLLDEAEWDRVMGANLKAPWLLSRLAAPAMAARGRGRIVNIGATSGLVRSHAAYGLAKAALLALTETLALELAPSVTVNAVVPSQIASARTDRLAGYKAAAIAATPLGRLVTEEELARMVTLLCGPDFDFVTGRAIVMDGGRAIAAFPRIGLSLEAAAAMGATPGPDSN